MSSHGVLDQLRQLSLELDRSIRLSVGEWWKTNHQMVARLVFTYESLSKSEDQPLFGISLKEVCLTKKNPQAIIRVSDRTFRRWIKVVGCDEAYSMAIQGKNDLGCVLPLVDTNFYMLQAR